MPDHRGIPVWDVEIPIVGLVSIRRSFELNVRKEIYDSKAFYSEIRVAPKGYGFLVSLTAFAPTASQAEEAGLVFLGRMLDVLSTQLGTALSVMSPSVLVRQTGEPRVKRCIGRDEVLEAFLESRKLTLSETTYLRALGWFRKGLCTTDPLDRFLAFWNAIEVVASKYNPNKHECKKRGSICHIWESFKHCWGACENWPLIAGKSEWIDENNKKRKGVAHGTIATDVESVSNITASLTELEAVSRQFLLDWRHMLTVTVDPRLME